MELLIGNVFLVMLLLVFRAFVKYDKSRLNYGNPKVAYITYIFGKYTYYLLLVVSIPYIVISTLVASFALVVDFLSFLDSR